MKSKPQAKMDEEQPDSARSLDDNAKSSKDEMSEKKFMCDQCAFITSRRNSLDAHRKGVHENTRDHKCTQCDYATARKDSLYRHIQEVHDKVKRGQVKCDQCDYIGTEVSKHKLSVHPKRVVLGKDHKCDRCGHTFAHVSSLQRHIREIHEQIRRGQMKCDHCDYVSEGVNVLKHMKSAHRRKFEYDKNFKCDRCDYASTRQIHLNLHIKGVHDKIKDQKCDKCQYATAVKSRLRRHIREVHDKVLGDIVQCDQCDYKSIKSNLSFHKKSAHGAKDYKCKSCSYATRTANYLRSHVKQVHEKVRNHKCVQCGYAAFLKTTLQEHIRVVHEGIKDFKCEKCEFQTSKSYRYMSRQFMIN